MLNLLRAYIAVFDRLNDWLSRGLAVMVWFVAGICAAVVVLRYGFHISFTWMQELYVWVHAVVFLGAASYAMMINSHVRVDIVNSNWSVRTRAVVEIIGTLIFTLPWVVILAWFTWPFIVDSWSIREGSSQSNGMPGVYLLRTALLGFSALMTVQCLSLIARCILALSGDKDIQNSPPFARTSSVLDDVSS